MNSDALLKQVSDFLSRRLLRLRIATWVVAALSVGYAVIFSYITIMKYFTFNATTGDLGITNEVYWQVLHGTYFKFQYNLVYPFPIQSPGLLFALPLYALYPHPETLLVVQAIALGAAAIPLYLIVVRACESVPAGLVLSGAYLAFFPMEGANMFDFHPESFFPLLVFCAFLAYLSGRRWTATVFGLLAGLIEPVCLGVVVFLFAYLALSEVHGTGPLRFRNIWKSIWPQKFALISSLLIFLTVVVLTQSQAPTLGVTTATYSFSLAGVLSDLNDKVFLLAALLAPVVFIPLLDSPLIFVALPYVGWAFFSLAGAAHSPFYHQYVLIGTPVVFLATADALVRYRTGNTVKLSKLNGVAVLRTPSTPSWEENPPASYRLPRRSLRPRLLAICAASVVLFCIYSPLGPLNSSLPQSVFDGNYGVSTVITYTPHDALLWKIVDLIPPQASVLTQNGIPQVSGRPYFETAGANMIPGLVPTFILGDSSPQPFTAAFSGYSQLYPYILNATRNDTYGLYAYAGGILLLKHGFTGTPVFFESPPPDLFLPSAFAISNGALIDGGAVAVHTPEMGASAVFWFGPYASEVLSGQYWANFTLMINTTGLSGSDPIITLQVTANSGLLTLANLPLNVSSFQPSGEWTTFPLPFILSQPTDNIEFRGVSVANVTTVYFSGVSVAYGA
ncbi:MAG: DUF2079 domain-containing protein [Thermoplasmata archaeon]